MPARDAPPGPLCGTSGTLLLRLRPGPASPGRGASAQAPAVTQTPGSVVASQPGRRLAILRSGIHAIDPAESAEGAYEAWPPARIPGLNVAAWHIQRGLERLTRRTVRVTPVQRPPRAADPACLGQADPDQPLLQGLPCRRPPHG